MSEAKIKVHRIQADRYVECMCGANFHGQTCEAEGREHARQTGHSPTLTVTYDLTPENFTGE